MSICRVSISWEQEERRVMGAGREALFSAKYGSLTLRSLPSPPLPSQRPSKREFPKPVTPCRSKKIERERERERLPPLPLTPLSQNKKRGDLSNLGLVRGIFESLFALPAGFLADRLPRPQLILAGSVIWAAGLIGCAFSPEPDVFLCVCVKI